MPMKPYIAAVAAIVMTSLAGAARAEPVELEFARLCLSSSTAAEATAKARAEGYKAAPEEILSKLKGFPDSGEVLWRADDGEISVFVAASMTRRMLIPSSQAVKGDMCVVASLPAQRDVQTKLEQMLNVGRAQPFGNDSAYIFELTSSGPVALDGTDKALLMVKIVQGTARMAAAMERRHMTGVMLMIPAIAPAKSGATAPPPPR